MNKKWCKEIQWLDGRWRQTGPAHQSWDVYDVDKEVKFCCFCGTPRPVEPKTLAEKLFEYHCQHEIDMDVFCKRAEGIAKSHFIEVLENSEGELTAHVKKCSFFGIHFKTELSGELCREIIDFLKGRL